MAVTAAYLGMAISAYATNFSIHCLGLGWTFVIFAAVCATLAIYAMVCLPEAPGNRSESSSSSAAAADKEARVEEENPQ